MQKKAFTLIELAIVLTIIGLLIGGSFKVMKMMREKAKTAEAKELVLGAKNAVIGFAMQNYYLPNSAEFLQNLSPIKDANHPLLYTTDYNLSQYDICAFTSTDLGINNNGTPIEDVAFVILHEGANYNMQTASSSTQINIYAQSVSRDDNTTPVNKAEPYDDIVEWVTLKQLQENIGCVNLPFRFINDKLPTGKEGVDYNATLYVENNVSEVDIACTLQAGTVDRNITFNGVDRFGGVPSSSGEVVYDCLATEQSGSNRAPASKRFVIVVDPDYSVGASCADVSDCESGFCINGVCSSGTIGSICAVGADCQSGFCAGALCTTGAFDIVCDDGTDCKSGICQGGLCSGYLSDACTANSECLSGYCNGTQCAIMPSGDSNGTSGGGSGTLLPNGSSCTSDSQCQSGNCHTNGKCTAN